MLVREKVCRYGFLLGAWVLFAARAAEGGLTLTNTAVSQGFGISTFASGFSDNSNGVGPVGIAFPSTGGVIVTDEMGNLRQFASDSDGQTAGSAPSVSWGTLNAYAFAPFAGNLFMTEKAAGKVVELGPAGNLIEPIINVTSATGIVADPATGRLYVSTAFETFPNIYAIDPATKSVTQFVGNTDGDGLALSADRKTLYVAIFDQKVVGYDVASRAKVFDSGPIPGGVDGIGLGLGGLADKAIVTTHGGTLVEVDLKTAAQSVLATGGSRGDTAIADPRGSLLVTQSTSVERLTPPPGSAFLPDLLPGDANGDGAVNFSDLLILAQHYGGTGNWLEGDFDGDQTVGFGDLLLLAQNYGLPSTAGPLAAVPEPFGLPCFTATIAALSLRRRREQSNWI